VIVPPKQTDIAAHLDLSVSRVREYFSRGTFPRDATLDEIRVAYLRHLRARQGGVTRERDRLDAARANLAELQLKERRGELIDRGDVESIGAGIMSVTVQRMMGLRNIAPEVRSAGSDAEAATILERAVREALSDIARLGDLVGEAQREGRRRAGKRQATAAATGAPIAQA
jgi:hypothetical protein